MAKTSLLMSAVDNISPATKTAAKSQESLTKELEHTRKEAHNTNKQLANVKSYQTASSAVEKASAAHKRFSKNLDNQKQALKGVKNPTQEQSDKLAILEQKVTDSSIKLRDGTRRLNRLGTELKAASIDTDKLADAQQRLTRRSAKYTEEVKQQSKELKKLAIEQDGANDAAKDGGGDMGGVVAAAGTVAGSMLAASNNQDSYLQVRNAANWDEKSLAENEKWAVKASTQNEYGGANVQEIHQAQAMAIRGGSETVETSQEAAKNILQMSKMFNVEVQEAGELYNKFKNGYGLDDKQAQASIAQAKNSTKSLSAERGLEVFDEVLQVSGKHKAANMDFDTVTALTAALTGSGLEASSASAITENFSERVSFGAGEEQSKDTVAAYKMIGLDVGDIKGKAGEDSKGFTLDILKQLQALKKSGGDADYAAAHIFGSDGAELMGHLDKVVASLDKPSLSNTDAIASYDDSYALRMDSLNQQSAIALSSIMRLVDVIGSPLLEPLTMLAQYVNTGATAVADYLEASSGLTRGLVGVGAAVGIAIAGMKAFGAFKQMMMIKAGVVNVSGSGLGGGGSTSKNIKKGSRAAGGASRVSRVAAKAGGIASGLVGSGALKAIGGLAKIGMRAVPMLGTALLAYDAANFASEALTGKGVIDNIKGFFTDDDEKYKASSVADKALKLPLPQSTVPIPTTEQYDKKAEAVRKQESTNTLNINLSGKVEGLSPQAEIELMREAAKHMKNSGSFSGIDDREGYA